MTTRELYSKVRLIYDGPYLGYPFRCLMFTTVSDERVAAMEVEQGFCRLIPS